MLIEFVLSVVIGSPPPLPPPQPNVIKKLEKHKVGKSRITKGAENLAPISDKLKNRFKEVEVEKIETTFGVVLQLEVPEVEDTLVRLEGPTYRWPHGNCYMCLGNHLISKFGQSKEYLDKIGYKQWGILYDNLYNDPEYEGVKGKNEGYYGSSTGGSFRSRGIGIFGRGR